MNMSVERLEIIKQQIVSVSGQERADLSWKTYTFEKLIEKGSLIIGDGYRAKNEELGGDGHIFLRAGHVTDTHIDLTGVERFHVSLSDKVAGKMAQARDVVITTKGNSTGRTTYISSDLPPLVYSPHLSF